MPAWILPAVQTAATVGSALFQSQRQRRGVERQNKENRIEAQRQRDWNIDQWHRQNEYNHPQQQMARLSQAGLNPNLVYGTGAQSAVGNAGDVKGYDRAEARNVSEGFDAFSNMYAFNNMRAKTDNLEAQNEVLKQDAINKNIESVGMALSNQKKSFDLGLATELRDSTLQGAISDSKKKLFDSQKALADSNVAINTQDTRIKSAQIQLNRAIEDLSGQKLLNELRRLETNLNRMGVQKSDNMIFRMLMQNPKSRQAIQTLMDTGIDLITGDGTMSERIFKLILPHLN